MKEEVEEVTTVSETHPEHVVKTTRVVTPGMGVEHPQKILQKKKTIFRFYQIVWYVLSIIEILLIFRFALRALGANPYVGFTAFIYTLSGPFAYPFLGIIAPSVTGANVMEWSTIIAGIVYLLVAYGIVELSQFVKPVSPQEVTDVVDA